METYKSNCCGEDIISSHGLLGNTDSMNGNTYYLECTKCKRPCNMVIENKKESIFKRLWKKFNKMLDEGGGRGFPLD